MTDREAVLYEEQRQAEQCRVLDLASSSRGSRREGNLENFAQTSSNNNELNRIISLSPFRNIGPCKLKLAGISEMHREALIAFAEFARTHEPEAPEKWCWIWPGPVVTDFGYGLLYVQDTPFPVYRLSFEHFKGLIPKGFVVMHTCDKPRCWNPNHLFLGTQKENLHDMIRKGRAGWQKRKAKSRS